MEIIFIRHSKTKVDPTIPITSWGLSEEGIEFARKLSSHPSVKTLDVIYTSFQTKALETAVLLAKPNGVSIRPDNGLTEVTSLTEKFEDNFDIYEQRVKDYYHGKIERINNGESINEAQERFIREGTEVSPETRENIVDIFKQMWGWRNMHNSAVTTHLRMRGKGQNPQGDGFEYDKKLFRLLNRSKTAYQQVSSIL